MLICVATPVLAQATGSIDLVELNDGDLPLDRAEGLAQT